MCFVGKFFVLLLLLLFFWLVGWGGGGGRGGGGVCLGWVVCFPGLLVKIFTDIVTVQKVASTTPFANP